MAEGVKGQVPLAMGFAYAYDSRGRIQKPRSTQDRYHRLWEKLPGFCTWPSGLGTGPQSSLVQTEGAGNAEKTVRSQVQRKYLGTGTQANVFPKTKGLSVAQTIQTLIHR